jgi:hypothetical protein
MEKRAVLHELTMEHIEDLADQLSRLAECSQIYYFGSRRWDLAISFGVVEFILVTAKPETFTTEVQDEILRRLSINADILLTFVDDENDVMSRAILVWPLKS